MFTDGLTEAADPSGREFGLDRLDELLVRHGDLDATELAERIVSEVDRFADGADRVDDLTLVIGRVR
jgi:sigma-B regulation protein RsbU (phosphoserine phosphatase)